jgi:hypothetical protein
MGVLANLYKARTFYLVKGRMAGRYYPGVDSERISRKAKALRALQATGQGNVDKPKSGRGGARPGTGPKPLEPKIRRSVGLSERQWAIFDARGGNDWLREDLDKEPQANQKSVDGV